MISIKVNSSPIQLHLTSPRIVDSIAFDSWTQLPSTHSSTQEHEICINSLNFLAKMRTTHAGKVCYQILADHFKSEEELLDKTIYKGVISSLLPTFCLQKIAWTHSSRGLTHRVDSFIAWTHSPSTHSSADIVNGKNVGAFSVDANMRTSHAGDHKKMLKLLTDAIEKAAQTNSLIPINIVQKVMNNFESHADKYDGTYAERLAIALAMA